MANVRKFQNPIVIQIRVEKEVKNHILEKYGNMTDFVNVAINEKIKKEQK